MFSQMLFPSAFPGQKKQRFGFSLCLATILCLLLISSCRAFPLDPTNGRLFFTAALRDPNSVETLMPQIGNGTPMFQFVGTADQFADLQKRRAGYDRNCFFSPVQCMLLFKHGTNLMGSEIGQ